MRRKIVLVGGGHSHVQVLESLQSDPIETADVTVVVDKPISIYSGMVPGFVAGQYQASELQIDVPPLCEWAGVECIVEPVARIQAGSNRVILESGSHLTYDIASLNVGSTVASLDLEGIREFAIPTRPISRLIERTEEVVENAGRRNSAEPFRVLVVGGGAGGVELAFTFLERLKRSGCGEVEAHLINAGPRILEGYPASLARRTERAATVRGIKIHCNQRVNSAHADRVVMASGDEWPYDALLWVTGAVSHGILRNSGLPTEERGFVRTHSTLQVQGIDNLFAVGDCATLIDYPETPKAGVYAVRQGPYLTHNLRAMLADEPLRRYHPQSDFLTLLNLGDGTALGSKKNLSFQGRWVMKLKDWIDRRFMHRFQIAPRSQPDAVG